MLNKKIIQKTFVSLLLSIVISFPTFVFNNNNKVSAEINKNNNYEEQDTDFNLTKNYVAYAEPYTCIQATTTMLKPRTITLNDPARHEMKVSLDGEKNGLLLTSKKTGMEAIGAEFALKNKQLGDFSMDFRVFSKETYRGFKEATSIKQSEYKEGDGLIGQVMGSAEDSRFNPYLDLRGLGITFTSVEDNTKEFTIHLYGGQSYAVTSVIARAEIKGEPVFSGGRKGYGLLNGINQPDVYGYATELVGTSFCNSSLLSKTFPVSIRFDKNKMCVYGKSYEYKSLGNGTGRYIESERLIRNLNTNNMKDDNTGDKVNYSNMSTLSSSDFESGYTVKFTVEDMTDNKTELTWAAGKNLPDEGEFKSVNSPVYNQEVRNYEVSGGSDGVINRHLLPKPYERNANILIYNVNDMEMRNYEGFDVQEQIYEFPKHIKGVVPPTASKKIKGLRYTAKAKNNQVVGESFKLNAEDFVDTNGILGIKIGAISQNYATKISGSSKLDHIGNDNIAIDPYSDVRQISLTIKSKEDKTKGFKVYLTSRTLEQGAMVATVEILGEDIINRSGVRGIGEDNTTNQADQKLRFTKSMGTFGMYNNMFNDSYNNQKDPYPMITFDPQTLELKCFTYDYNLIRKLDKEYKLGNYSLKTLNTNDFKNGFDVEVTVEQMNNQFNKGLQEWYFWGNSNMIVSKNNYDVSSDGIHILEDGYDRSCTIDVYSYVDGKNVQKNETIKIPNEGKYELDLGNNYVIDYKDEGIKFTPKLTNTLGKTKDIDYLEYINSNGEKTKVQTVNGCVLLKDLKPGVYEFSYEKYKRTIRINTDKDPVLTLKDNREKIYQNEKFEVSYEDIDVQTRWEIKDYRIETYFNGRPIKLDEVNSKFTGIYNIIYKVVDEGGREVSLERNVIIAPPDTDIPIIIWNCPNLVKVGEVIRFENLDAFDSTQGMIKATINSIKFTSNKGEIKNIDPSIDSIKADLPGEYTIVLEAIDDFGNKTDKSYRILVVDNEETQSEENSNGNKNGCNGNMKNVFVISMFACAIIIMSISKNTKKDNIN